MADQRGRAEGGKAAIRVVAKNMHIPDSFLLEAANHPEPIGRQHTIGGCRLPSDPYNPNMFLGDRIYESGSRIWCGDQLAGAGRTRVAIAQARAPFPLTSRRDFIPACPFSFMPASALELSV